MGRRQHIAKIKPASGRVGGPTLMTSRGHHCPTVVGQSSIRPGIPGSSRFGCLRRRTKAQDNSGAESEVA